MNFFDLDSVVKHSFKRSMAAVRSFEGFEGFHDEVSKVKFQPSLQLSTDIHKDTCTHTHTWMYAHTWMCMHTNTHERAHTQTHTNTDRHS